MGKLFDTLILLLGIALVYCNIQSCDNKHGTLKFSKPPAVEEFWQSGIVIWPSIPVRIKITDDPLRKELEFDAINAAEMWNFAIGCTVLEVSEDADSEITVTMSPVPKGRNWAGSATFVHRNYKGRTFWGSNIEVYELRLNDMPFRSNLMGHELGHALGLDDLEDSTAYIMNHSCEYGTDIDKDALAALHKIYCAK